MTGSALASGPSPLGRRPAPTPPAAPARPAAPAPGRGPGPAPTTSAPATRPNVTHAPTILPNQKTVTTIDAAVKAMIERYVQTEVGLLAYPDSGVVKDAKDRIDRALVGSPPPSAEYQAEFARQLNAALLPLFKHPEMRVRLNAAIVLQHAAEKFDNVLLAPAATAAVSDSALPVVIWGVKASRNLVAGNLDLLPATRNNALLAAVAGAVKRFPTSGALAEDVYDVFANIDKIASSDKRAA